MLKTGVAVGTAHDAEATGAATLIVAMTTAAATAHEAIPTGALTDWFPAAANCWRLIIGANGWLRPIRAI